ncbi:hypothetical protein AFK68_20840 [Hydrocoleum sp. CS-953]|nr:hypothetical protein AFK68_20840 [Hydrocoleum sp. CS-953]
MKKRGKWCGVLVISVISNLWLFAQHDLGNPEAWNNELLSFHSLKMGGFEPLFLVTKPPTLCY